MQPLVSVIVPTVGRKSLRRTLKRLRRERDVEVLVVGDGPCENALRVSRRYGAAYTTGPLTRSWGNAQRDVGISHATGRYLMFIDDDDVHTRGAFKAVRRAVAANPNRIVVFRMKTPRMGVLWRHKTVQYKNVGTPMFVIPNNQGRIPKWVDHDVYEADFHFLNGCVRKQGEPVWDEAVIANVEPVTAATKLVRRVRSNIRRVRSKAAIRTRLRKHRR